MGKKRFLLEVNYFVIVDVDSSEEEFRNSADNITYKEVGGNISFYDKSTGIQKSVEIYNLTNIVNGDDSDNPFANLTALKLYLNTNTGFKTASGSGANTKVFTIGVGGQSVFNTGFDVTVGFQILLNGIVNESITANATITDTQQITTAVTITEFTVVRINN